MVQIHDGDGDAPGHVRPDEHQKDLGNPPQCSQCDTFADPYTPNQHVMEHSPGSVSGKMFRCEVPGCDKAYTRHTNLAQHVRTCHADLFPASGTEATLPMRKKQRTMAPEGSGNSSNDGKLFVCPAVGCDKGYAHQQSLDRHMKNQHPDHYHPRRTSELLKANDKHPMQPLNGTLLSQGASTSELDKVQQLGTPPQDVAAQSSMRDPTPEQTDPTSTSNTPPCPQVCSDVPDRAGFDPTNSFPLWCLTCGQPSDGPTELLFHMHCEHNVDYSSSCPCYLCQMLFADDYNPPPRELEKLLGQLSAEQGVVKGSQEDLPEDCREWTADQIVGPERMERVAEGNTENATFKKDAESTSGPGVEMDASSRVQGDNAGIQMGTETALMTLSNNDSSFLDRVGLGPSNQLPTLPSEEDMDKMMRDMRNFPFPDFELD
ncbi:hypothetical protein M8818_000351 [Zalaria obscura]|uniref:Uncharacterized protein n=1 Tax=Zalaria obscura TaxID=2024903 RepID=A0ACC3SML7_9PEZI